jgi:integrase
LNDSFKALLKKLNLPIGRDNGYTIHSLRHSFETICINASIPQRVVDAWLGHNSDRSMAAVYYRLSDEESQKFMLMVPFGTGASAASAGKEKVS